MIRTQELTILPTEKVAPASSESPTEAPTQAPTTVATEPTTQPEEQPEQPQEYADEPEYYQEDSPKGNYVSSGGDYDRELLARVIYLEAGGCSAECQRLVGSATLNLADMYGSLEAVAYDPNKFAVAGDIGGCSPDSLSYEMADALIAGNRNSEVMAFRAGYYHDFGSPYTSIDNVYFSTY